MSKINFQKEMLVQVATALDELLPQVVFIGGCTTGLFLTDDFTKEQVRYTDDVDLIVNVGSYFDWTQLSERLGQLGFRDSMEQEVICTKMLGPLKVVFMPDNADILGFSNRWYHDAMATARDFTLAEAITIKLVEPVYFVATKLEAYLGRGNGDALSSHDIEDLINIFDGRAEIVAEINAVDGELRDFIRIQLQALLDDANFEYAVQSATGNNSARESLIFERIEACL
jgi:predicted nucleotidyltransferase